MKICSAGEADFKPGNGSGVFSDNGP